MLVENNILERCRYVEKITTLISLAIFLIFSPNKAQTQILPFLHDQDYLELEFESKRGLMLVDVMINGKIPLKFVFDTGAKNVVLFDQEIGTLLNLKKDQNIQLRGANLTDTVSAYISRQVQLKVAQLPVVNEDIVILENYTNRLKNFVGTDIHGILGCSFFEHSVLWVNNRRGLIRFYNSAAWNKQKKKKYSQTKILSHSSKPYMPIEWINDGIKYLDTLLIDSGAGVYLILNLNYLHYDARQKSPLGVIGSGISGDLNGYLEQIESVKFQDDIYSNNFLPVQLVDSTMLRDYRHSGMIGNLLLSRYNWVIDYAGDIFYAKKLKSKVQNFRMNRSGLSVIATGIGFEKIVIDNIAVGSSSEEQDLKIGDEIIKINGYPTKILGIKGVYKLFSKREGKAIKLTIKRDEDLKRVQIQLRNPKS